MLAILIKNSHIAGIEVMGKTLTISQLADDTTLFLKNKDQILLVLQIITKFSKASGLQLNLNKCELFALKDSAIFVQYKSEERGEIIRYSHYKR